MHKFIGDDKNSGLVEETYILFLDNSALLYKMKPKCTFTRHIL